MSSFEFSSTSPSTPFLSEDFLTSSVLMKRKETFRIQIRAKYVNEILARSRMRTINRHSEISSTISSSNSNSISISPYHIPLSSSTQEATIAQAHSAFSCSNSTFATTQIPKSLPLQSLNPIQQTPQSIFSERIQVLKRCSSKQSASSQSIQQILEEILELIPKLINSYSSEQSDNSQQQLITSEEISIICKYIVQSDIKQSNLAMGVMSKAYNYFPLIRSNIINYFFQYLSSGNEVQTELALSHLLFLLESEFLDQQLHTINESLRSIQLNSTITPESSSVLLLRLLKPSFVKVACRILCSKFSSNVSLLVLRLLKTIVIRLLPHHEESHLNTFLDTLIAMNSVILPRICAFLDQRIGEPLIEAGLLKEITGFFVAVLSRMNAFSDQRSEFVQQLLDFNVISKAFLVCEENPGGDIATIRPVQQFLCHVISEATYFQILHLNQSVVYPLVGKHLKGMLTSLDFEGDALPALRFLQQILYEEAKTENQEQEEEEECSNQEVRFRLSPICEGDENSNAGSRMIQRYVVSIGIKSIIQSLSLNRNPFISNEANLVLSLL